MQQEKESNTYNQMLKRVENITADIGQEDIDLDELIKKIEEGYALLDKMQDRLNNTKLIIDKIEKKHESQ